MPLQAGNEAPKVEDIMNQIKKLEEQMDLIEKRVDRVTDETKAEAARISSMVRQIRGGSFVHEANVCRSASRSGSDPSGQYYFLGFRPVSVIQP